MASEVLPKLSAEVAQALELPISQGNVQAAMCSFAIFKALGPDGLTVDLYKLFSKQLAGPLVAVFLKAIEKGSLPPSLTEAELIQILKKGKNPEVCDSSRLIALMNSDAKTLAMVLAGHLRPLVVARDSS